MSVQTVIPMQNFIPVAWWESSIGITSPLNRRGHLIQIADQTSC
jgi:hypothetical protein